jgi:hypothetical protein
VETGGFVFFKFFLVLVRTVRTRTCNVQISVSTKKGEEQEKELKTFFFFGGDISVSTEKDEGCVRSALLTKLNLCSLH